MVPTDDSDVFVPGELIGYLSSAYQEMQDCADTWRALSDSDHEAGYPVFIPTHGTDDVERRSLVARQLAVKESTGLDIDDVVEKHYEAGLICASPEIVSAVDALNQAKAGFKDIVLQIRALATTNKPLSRDKFLSQAMQSAGIQTLHLRECYRQIRIMPPHLEVFAWTWATSHARIQKVSFEKAIEMAENLRDRDEQLAEIVIDILRKKCASDEVLAKRVTLPNQLRANYVYREDDQLVRKSCPLSGIVIAQQATLPRLVWRPNPKWSETQAIKLPRESIIEKEPLIEVLNLYRYVSHGR